ncbi:hypothetical protein SAMN06265222_107204 [Neorhodopirellula lusitana]|uniref:Uncharacterized protein n=1 Tax=Neorhodopirellula lusitana TaxID=445327 RepID=A0ABY1Q7A6_9BACT|nr:hypothetical protein SAMN06265222_107204 [Neorhodopirellula lusitana]
MGGIGKRTEFRQQLGFAAADGLHLAALGAGDNSGTLSQSLGTEILTGKIAGGNELWKIDIFVSAFQSSGALIRVAGVLAMPPASIPFLFNLSSARCLFVD